jgi:hypothetical protein
MKLNSVIGIDPGYSGGIVKLGSTGVVDKCSVIPIIKDKKKKIVDITMLRRLIFSLAPRTTMAFIEMATAMPKQGVVAMFNYGVCFGIIQGVVASMGIPITLVHPRTWTNKMHLGVDKTLSTKTRSLVTVKRLFPNVNLCVNNSKKFHDGLVDALLIAEFGRRYLS